MTISAAQFRQQCLRLMNQVEKTHRDILITRRGRPVARLAPTLSTKRPRLFGFLNGQAQIKDDIISPLGIRWSYDADKF